MENGEWRMENGNGTHASSIRRLASTLHSPFSILHSPSAHLYHLITRHREHPVSTARDNCPEPGELPERRQHHSVWGQVKAGQEVALPRRTDESDSRVYMARQPGTVAVAARVVQQREPPIDGRGIAQ